MKCARCGKEIDGEPAGYFEVFPEYTVRRLFDFKCDFKTTERAANIIVSKRNRQPVCPNCTTDSFFIPNVPDLFIPETDLPDLKWLDDLLNELYLKDMSEN